MSRPRRNFYREFRDGAVRIVNEIGRPAARFLRPLRQIIESTSHTLKAQLAPERHRGRTRAGVAVRVPTQLLAVTADVWHNRTHHDQPACSLTAYDH